MSDFTFDGFEPANTTPVPDVLFDKLLPHLNEAQIKVMLYIIRRTLGFKKTSDAISLKQFRYGIKTKDGKQLDEGCGLKNYTTIIAALKYLEQLGCIESDKRETSDGDQATTVYRVRFRGTTRNVVPPTQPVVGVLRKTEDGTAPSGGRVLRETEPQETVIQQTVQQETEESTFPALATSPIASSHDEDAHALSSPSCSLCSEQGDIQPCRECGTRLCFEHRRDFPYEREPTRILCVECLRQQNRMMVERASTNTELVSALAPTAKAEPRIASTTLTAEPAPPKAARKPRAPKPVDDGLHARIERVYAFFDSLGQEVTEDSDYHYRHTKKATEAITEWLKSNPTEAILREVYLKLWNTPADQRSGFDWQQNMSIVAVLGQYDRMALAIKASRKGSKSNLHLVASASRDSGLKSYSREELLKLPV